MRCPETHRPECRRTGCGSGQSRYALRPSRSCRGSRSPRPVRACLLIALEDRSEHGQEGFGPCVRIPRPIARCHDLLERQLGSLEMLQESRDQADERIDPALVLQGGEGLGGRDRIQGLRHSLAVSLSRFRSSVPVAHSWLKVSIRMVPCSSCNAFFSMPSIPGTLFVERMGPSYPRH